METSSKTKITVETTANAPVEKVWKYWSAPEHVTKWNQPSEDWHSPRAENDLRTGGKFVTRMEARDGSVGFDFGGTYDDVQTNQKIEYTMSDGRQVKVIFTADGNKTKVVESFDPENIHPEDMQRAGWQAILDSFRNYVENN